MTEFEKKLRAAAGKCLEEDETKFRSLESQETPILRTKRTERRNTMSTLKKTVKVASLVLVCTLAVTAAVTMSVKAIRVKVTNAVVSWYKNYATVEYEGTDTNTISTEKIKVMKPTCVPERYRLTRKFANEHLFTCDYIDKDSNELLYRQTNSASVISVETYNRCKESTISLSDEQQAELFTYDNGKYILTWYDGENYFYIESNELSYDELILFAESLEETEVEINAQDYLPEEEGKIYIFPNGDTVELTYTSQSTDNEGIVSFEYEDKFHNKYTFKNDLFIGVMYDKHYPESKYEHEGGLIKEKSKLTKEEIVKSVESDLWDLYGDRFNGFYIKRITESSLSGKYDIEYKHLIGEGKAVETGNAFVHVKDTGDIIYCQLFNNTDFDDFDESALDGITKADFEAFFKEKALEKCPNSTDIKVNSIYLIKNKGKIEIAIYGECYYPIDFDKLREDEAEMM